MANTKLPTRSPDPRGTGLFAYGRDLRANAIEAQRAEDAVRTAMVRRRGYVPFADMTGDSQKRLLEIARQAPKMGALITTDTAAAEAEPERLQGLRNRLAVSRKWNLAMLEIAKQRDSSMLSQYGNAGVLCMHRVVLENGTVTSNRCRSRSCLVCAAIDSQRWVLELWQHVEEWADEAWLLTLTRPTVGEDGILPRHSDNWTGIRTIRDAENRRRRKEGKPLLQLVCSEEATASEEKGTYHLHLHLTVRGEKEARAIMAAWLERYPDASPKAQDVRKIDGKNGLLEALKYTVKPYGRDGQLIAPDMAHALFSALKGRRRRSTSGIDRSTVDEADVVEAALDEIATDEGTAGTGKALPDGVYKWHDEVQNWVETSTGEVLLTGEVTEKTAERLDEAKATKRRAWARIHQRKRDAEKWEA